MDGSRRLRRGGGGELTGARLQVMAAHITMKHSQKIKGGGSGHPYAAVTTARSGLPKSSGGGGSHTGLDDNGGVLRWVFGSGDSSYGKSGSWGSSSGR
jgi:hypothetical protein